MMAHTIQVHIASSVDRSKEGKLEMDSHADSPVVGRGAMEVRDCGRTVLVGGFSDELGEPMRVRVIDALLLYEDDVSGEQYLLLIRNALSVPSMNHHLIPPFMMRLAGVEVDECAKFLSKKPSVRNHSLYFPDEDVRIPMSIHNIFSYVPTRMPSTQDVEDLKDKQLELTPQLPKWDPQTSYYQQREADMVNYRGDIREETIASTSTNHDNEIRYISEVLDKTLDPVLLANELTLRRQLSVSLPTESKTDASDPIGSFGIDVANVSVVRSRGSKSDLTPDHLASVWGISRDLAVRTLRVTTRYCPRNTKDISLNKRYSQNDRMLRYDRMISDLFMDTMFAKAKGGRSFRGYTCAQVFATDFGWAKPIFMRSKGDCHLAVKELFKLYGVPDKIICDAAREQNSGETLRFANSVGCHIQYLEKNTPSANRAESSIKILKHDTKKDLADENAPLVFWCFAMERRADINCALAKDTFGLHGQCAETMMTGKPTDISKLCQFKFYQWVKYRREGQQFPIAHERYGRCLGPAKGTGNEMSQWILTDKGQVLPFQTVRALTPAEINNPAQAEQRRELDKFWRKKFGDSINPPPEEDTQVPDEYKWDLVLDSLTPEADDIPDYDAFLDMEVLLPQNGEHLRAARVIGISENSEGSYDPNPVENSQIYDVMFPDGSVQQYAANIIAENLLGQIDDEGAYHRMLNSILDHRVDGTQSKRKGGMTTRGHELLVSWKDGTESWIPLKDMKESYPLETAEFAVTVGLEDDPAFHWWIRHCLRKRDQIISAVKHRMAKKNFKYGHQVPSSIKEAYDLDKFNKNTRWRDAIAKEMRNVLIAFKILEPDEELPPGREFVPCHLVFDVKMDGTAKARLVAAGCRTSDPEGSTWAGVVSRETVRLALVYAALNDLDVLAADIMNAYLTAPTSQKLWTKCGPEFGSKAGRKAIITRALYGNKSSGADFRNHLRKCMKMMKYESCPADPDLWMRLAKKDDGTEYYEYMLLYVDDALAIGEHPKEMLEELNTYFKLKPGSVGPPKIYLGAKLSLEELPNGAKAWGISSSKYIQDSIANLERKLEKKGLKLRPKVSIPLTSKYSPELDTSPELNAEDASLYMSLIGTLRWMVEMGRIDIACEVSMMSSYVAMPREGHLQQLYHMFGYLKAHHNARLIMDPSYPDILEEDFPKESWEQHYSVEKEAIPTNAPKPLGFEMVIRAFVDADHAGDKVTRRSRTGFVVFVNSAPVMWISKKQAGVETSTFGSEFLAMKACCEYLRGLRYKLRMMGIPLEHCCFVYGDNKSVLCNTKMPDSTLKKKHHSVAYHFVREGCARDEWRTTYIDTKDNCADILTKNLVNGINRKRKVRSVMYDIYPEEDERPRKSSKTEK